MPFAAQQFKADINKWFKAQQITHREACIMIALNLAENIIRQTPVDTGWARANWYPTLNKRITPPNTGVSNPRASNADVKGKRKKIAAAGAQAQSDAYQAAAGAFAQGKVGDLFILQNGVPYIRRLEYGWSKQAPRGMVRLSIERLKNFFETFQPGSTKPP